MNLALIKKHCEFDSCTTPASACSSLEQAAKECRNAGICIDWRSLTNGSCGMVFLLNFFLHSMMSFHTFLCFIDLVVIRFYFKKAVIHFSFNWYSLIKITLVS